MNWENHLEQIAQRYRHLGEQLASDGGYQSEEYRRLTKEWSSLTELAGHIETRQRLRDDLATLDELQHDGDLAQLVQEEADALQRRLSDLEQAIKRLLLPKGTDDHKHVILEVRAGTGGEEAALFAARLLDMYQRYAQLQGWHFDMWELTMTSLGGVKQGVAEIRGQEVFARLKFESGVHRVQRVPQTEANGRLHTSAATVAVLPEPEAVEVVIEDKDLRIDVFRSSGPGGQSVNTTDSAVRITHLPTGTVVTQQDEKSQYKNKAKAMKILQARLYERQQAASDAQRQQQRRTQVGSGDRSERIRTYNFPQNRVTDHRIGVTLYKLEQIIAGEALNELIEALIVEEQATQLGAFETDFSLVWDGGPTHPPQ